MKLSKTVREKFNKYFKEMLEYYKLTDVPLYRNLYNGLEVCDISKLSDKFGVDIKYVFQEKRDNGN